MDADYLSRYALEGDFDPSGARQDFCSELATVSVSAWHEECLAVGITQVRMSGTLQEEEQALRASVGHIDPVQQFMGLPSMQDDNNYVSALIKGCTEETCTRHSAMVADRHP